METKNKKEILEVLNAVKIGIGTGDAIESMQYFYFTGKEVVGYNELRTVRTPFKSEFNCFVKASDLMNILSKISTEEVSVGLEKKKFMMKSGKFNIKLATITDKELIKLIEVINKDLKKAEFKSLKEEFLKAITLCEPFTSRNEVDETLTCINVDGKTITACDNRRIASVKTSHKMSKFFIPYKEVKPLADFNPVELSITDKWIHFKNQNGSIYSIKKIVGEFPDFGSMIKSDKPKIEFPNEIKEAVDIAALLADESSPVTITIKDGKCSTEFKNNSGKMKHVSSIKTKEKASFGINPLFFNLMLQQSTTFQIEDNRIITEAENFVLVSALMKE